MTPKVTSPLGQECMSGWVAHIQSSTNVCARYAILTMGMPSASASRTTVDSPSLREG